MEVIVDRIEGEYLVLELPSLKHINVPRILIPNALEGDIIDININYQKRKEKETEVKTISENLFLDWRDKDEE